jgi:hypothetical protein
LNIPAKGVKPYLPQRSSFFRDAIYSVSSDYFLEADSLFCPILVFFSMVALDTSLLSSPLLVYLVYLE